MNFGSYDALQLKEMIINGETKPSDAINHFLDKIRTANNHLNCFITITEDIAINSAQKLEQKISNGHQLGILAGVPIAVKDNIITKDILTTCGSGILQDFRPPYNATVVENLLAEDAIIIGKTNMDEFGMGSSNENSYFGTVANPIDNDYVPGGSSGGSACAVSSHLVPIALGSDTGGSIRQPSSFCGVIGLKPSYGAVSRHGLIAFGSSLDQIGPITRTVDDCALMFSVLSGYDCKDSTCSLSDRPDYQKGINDFEKLKIGVPDEYFGEGIDHGVRQSVEKALDKLQDIGCERVCVSLPNTDKAIAAYYIIANAEASSNLARYDGVRYGFRSDQSASIDDLYKNTRSEGFGDEVKRRIMLGTYVLSSGYYDAYYKKASRIREVIRRDFQDAFSKVDLIITPTSPTPAFKLGEKTGDPLAMYLSDIYTVSVNLAGLPAISVPCGKTSAGLPIGLQIIGGMFEESMIFKLAKRLEKELAFK
jgi:aspartyl-tRNA(Asn)/glutamyl-tRNA(Gln) amidotransferase subunit A